MYIILILFLDYTWTLLDYIYGSDHFSILFTPTEYITCKHIPFREFSKNKTNIMKRKNSILACIPFYTISTQSQGVPHSSILSVTLLSIKTNSISFCVKFGIHETLFIDDFSVSYCSKIMFTILHRRTFGYLDNGLQFLSTETVCMHFC